MSLARRLVPSLALSALLSSAAWAAPAPAPVVETMSLEQAVSRLAEDSPTAMQLAGRVAEARSMVRLSAAPALPMVVVQGGYNRNRDDAVVSLANLFGTLGDQLPIEIDTSGLPDDLVIQPLEQWTVGASVSVPLVQPQAWADVGVARKGLEAAQHGVASASQQAEAGLVKASWLTQAAEQRLAAAAHAEEAATRHWDSAKARLEAGTGTELEVLVAQTELTRRQSDALQAVADLDAARRALGALLGVDGAVAIEVGAGTAASGLDPDGAASMALSLRPDLQSAEARMEAARRGQTSAWLRHLPTIAGTAAVFGSDVAYPTGEKDGWRLGLQATWVLFDGGARYGLLDRAKAQGMQAQGTVAQLELDASRQARDAVAAVHVAQQRLVLASQAADTATRAEASAQRLYQAGLVSHLDAIDAVQRRLDAELGRAGATAQVGVARADLGVATGQGWTRP